MRLAEDAAFKAVIIKIGEAYSLFNLSLVHFDFLLQFFDCFFVLIVCLAIVFRLRCQLFHTFLVLFGGPVGLLVFPLLGLEFAFQLAHLQLQPVYDLLAVLAGQCFGFV
jgi:hypothetical protein